jgi:hypothetical protein
MHENLASPIKIKIRQSNTQRHLVGDGKPQVEYMSDSSVSMEMDQHRNNILEINKKTHQQGSQSKMTPKKNSKDTVLSLKKSIYNIEIPSSTHRPPPSVSARSITSARSHISKKNVIPPMITEDLKRSTSFLIRKQLCFGAARSNFMNDANVATQLYLNQFQFFCFLHFPRVHRKMSSRMHFNNLV